MSYLKLLSESIFQIPFENYVKDFTFIVNGKEYSASKIVADLLSTKISSQHLVDPTMNQIIINTRENGNFQLLLDLISFKPCSIEDKDLSFISEIFEQLQPKYIEFKVPTTEPTIDNIFDKLSQHERQHYLYFNALQNEINFLSTNLYQIPKDREHLFESLQYDTLDLIFGNENLQLESEDQLFRIVNRLYQKNSEYSAFYEYVDFVNVSKDSIIKFAQIFDEGDLTGQIWRKMLARLQHEVKVGDEEKSKRSRRSTAEVQGNEIQFKGNSFDGIFNRLKTTSNIRDEVSVTKSSEGHGNVMSLFDYDDQHSGPCTCSNGNEWFCFEFKKHRVIPTCYTIKTNSSGCYPKTWVVECSNDNVKWEKVDEQMNCSSLNGKYTYHSFPISTQKQIGYKFVRLKLTGLNYHFYISCRN